MAAEIIETVSTDESLDKTMAVTVTTGTMKPYE